MLSSIRPLVPSLALMRLVAPEPVAAQAEPDADAVRGVIQEAYVTGVFVTQDARVARRGFHPQFVLQSAPPLVRYTVYPHRTAALVALQITTRFHGEPDGLTRFSLPVDRFGVPEMHSWIQQVRASTGTRLTVAEPGVYMARHEPGAQVEISYTVAYDRQAAGFVAFGPSVGPDHFHFFGSQWMARVGADNTVRRVAVTFKTDGWRGAVGSSYGLGDGPHQVLADDYQLDYSVIAGGDYRTAQSSCRNRPVLTMVRGAFAVPDSQIFRLAARIVCGQREAFDDFERPFFTVFVTERERIEAGAPVLNGFTTFLETDTSLEELRGLLAHEMIHTWLPRTARLVDPARPDASDVWTRWFHEGFTEYLARVVLVRQELATRSWMVERTNEDVMRLAYHPYRTLTLEELEQAAGDRRYNNHHHRLHYLRGALLALNWDERIRAATAGERSLLDAVRAVVVRAKASGGTISLPALVEVFGQYGVDVQGDVDRHLHGARPLSPPAGAFAPAYELGYRERPRFDLGLDLTALIEARRVVGLVPDGPAAQVGARDGMRVLATENASPWTGRWDPALPSVLVVEKGAARRRMEVRADGAPISIPTFVVRGRGR